MGHASITTPATVIPSVAHTARSCELDAVAPRKTAVLPSVCVTCELS